MTSHTWRGLGAGHFYDQMWQFVTILAIFQGLGRQIFGPKLPSLMMFWVLNFLMCCGDQFGNFFCQSPGHTVCDNYLSS